MNGWTITRGMTSVALLSLLCGCVNEGGADGASAQATFTGATDQSAAQASPTAPTSLKTQIDEAAPRATRAGFLRFFDPAFRAPGAVPHIVARAERESSEDVRAALADALVHHPGGFGEAAATWMAKEASAQVRLALVSEARRAALPYAEALIIAGLEDTSASVRATAASQVARIDASARLTEALRGALLDGSTEVRRAALRSVSALPADADILSDVARVRRDADPAVREAAVRAMARMTREGLR